MGFIIGVLIGFVIIIVWLKYSARKYYEANNIMKEVTVRTLSFNDSISGVREILEQLSRHQKLGCTSYICIVPFELAYTEVFHQFISEYKYTVILEKTGYKFEILL